jgi:vacuolar-type H+-ATPase subunit E/Vma4
VNDSAANAFNPAGETSVLDTQVAELLRRVQSDYDDRCRQLREKAETEAHEILRGARKEARDSVRQAIAGERARIEHSLRQARAGAAMQERLSADQSAQRLLAEMWQALPSLLQARWGDRDQRRTWIQSAAQQACAVLSGRPWRVEHGGDISDTECREIIKAACERSTHAGPSSIECVLDSQLPAGIRIVTQSARLDATIPGLLANRSDIEAAFLAEYSALTNAPSTERASNE